ncbi:hypothetical protein RND71_028328 [Anisodus tanguticus]|uniref:AIG1-type G domain-containing protein n=1 Tax=Anisodus tanguticus TaxID=243964 RepID=A0AAE1V9Z0_9SOLA|nr:hypothetical protein RND71_028328 [Anisodus tanguticus]
MKELSKHLEFVCVISELYLKRLIKHAALELQQERVNKWNIGLFDFSAEPEFVGNEIVKCINMAKDGIHAVVVVLSMRTRFSREEQAAVQSLSLSLRELFGSKISDYMNLVFTGGDDLEDNDETLDDYFCRDCPEPLKNALTMCGNRRVLLDKETKDPLKKADQLEQLIFLVNVVVENNGGKPYTDDLFKELKVESKLKETTHRLEEKLAKEQAARLKAELSAKEAQKKSDDEIRKLREYLERAQKESEELRGLSDRGMCNIL